MAYPVAVEDAQRLARAAARIVADGSGHQAELARTRTPMRRVPIDPELRFDRADEIYDISGRLLFRDLASKVDDDTDIVVRTAADRLLRTPVWSVRLTPPSQMDRLIAKAAATAATKGIAIPSGTRKVICYSYPKLALSGTDDKGRPCLIDLADQSVVSPTSLQAPRTAEARTVWSPFDFGHRATAAAHLDEFERSAQATLGQMAEPTGFGIVERRDSSVGQEAIPELETGPAEAGTMRWFAQQAPDYCTIACVEMILAFWGIAVTQPQIAGVMGLDPSDDGATIEQQLAAYRTLSGDRLLPEYDPTPSFNEAMGEIHEGRPLKTGMPGHARVCTGWSFRTFQDGSVIKWLRIFDPWPADEPNVYWENGLAVVHTNYIYVRRAVR